MPADFRQETIDKYIALNNSFSTSKVIETYGSITIDNVFGSGRSVSQLPRANLHDLEAYIQYSNHKGISFNYTMNPSFMFNEEFTKDGISKIRRFLKFLYNTGVRSLTVAMPSLIEIIKHEKYDFEIKLSSIANVRNANMARAYKRLGVQSIVVPEFLQRDFKTLKQVRDVFGDRVEIILNTICHRDCIYRQFHYNQLSQDSIEVKSKASDSYFGYRCMLQRYKNISELLKLGWVRPEDIKYYTSIEIYNFKLQGRQLVLHGDPVRTVKYYFKETYDGDLMELLDMFQPRFNLRVSLDNNKLDGFLKPFFENEIFCRSDCSHCRYCEMFAKKCIDNKKMQQFINGIERFCDEHDEFKKLLNQNMQREEVCLD